MAGQITRASFLPSGPLPLPTEGEGWGEGVWPPRPLPFPRRVRRPETWWTHPADLPDPSPARQALR